MTEAEFLFESYNMAVENGYNRLFENNNNAELLRLSDKEMFLNVAGDIKQWENAGNADIGGLTPSQFISGINDPGELIELFKLGSVMCDYELPELLLDRLKTFNEEASEILINFATDKNLIRDQKDYLIPVTSIRVLGQWGRSRAAGKLVNFFINEINENDENYDIVAEEISDYLVNIGMTAVELLLETLEKAEIFNSSYEYLLKSLAEIGRDNKNDRIFYCLKSSFRNMGNKVLGALYMKNYGDSRAIPLLRGYLERNAGNIDRETLYEIKHVIESLGGSLEGI